VAKCDLHERKILFDERFATTVMLVSGGYPESFEKGKVISGLDLTSESIVFHAGTRSEGDEILTNGGRVLAVSALGRSMEEALKESYRNAELLSFEGSYYRTDIGFDL
jgi:phosphoribosylamine--glycine ligase